MTKLRRSFFERDTQTVAQELIGCLVVHRMVGDVRTVRLVETEAYLGETDPAAHSYRGITPRTRPMFERGGILYVYFIYGMHWCANIVTEARGRGRAVLLRAGIADERINGPGRLAKYLDLSGDDTGRSVVTRGIGVYEDKATDDYRRKVEVTPRIGITKAVDLPLRYVVPPSRGA